MEVSTTGIVLRKIPYSSSSAIVAIYTRRFGLASFMVRGLGKMGGKNSAVQPLSQVEVSCSFREIEQVQTARQIHLKTGTGATLFGPVKNAIALFLAEVLYKSLREESPDPELFDYIDNALDFFSETPTSANFHLHFMMRLTKFLGFFPSGEWSEATPYFDLQNGNFTSSLNDSVHTLNREEAKAFDLCASSDFDVPVTSSNVVKRKVLSGIVTYYKLQLEGFGELKSLPILMELFSE